MNFETAIPSTRLVYVNSQRNTHRDSKLCYILCDPKMKEEWGFYQKKADVHKELKCESHLQRQGNSFTDYKSNSSVAYAGRKKKTCGALHEEFWFRILKTRIGIKPQRRYSYQVYTEKLWMLPYSRNASKFHCFNDTFLS